MNKKVVGNFILFLCLAIIERIQTAQVTDCASANRCQGQGTLGCDKLSGNNCQPCKQGFYGNSPNKCAVCVKGTSSTGVTTPYTGSNSISDCRCAQGYYYVASPASCQQCVGNTYKDTIADDTSCKTPPANSIVDSGKTSYSCNVGYFLNSSSVCDQCNFGFYKSSVGNGACTACGSNTQTSSKGSTAVTDCLCVAGYGYTGSTCAICSNSYKFTLGNVACTQCSTGAVCSGSSFTCAAGYFWNGSQCSQCSSTSYKATTGNQTCITCPSTFIADSTRTTCICPAGKTLSGGTCVDCVNGYKASVGNGTCTACPLNASCASLTGFSCNAGYVLNATSTGCSVCPANTYRSLSNSSCLLCTANSVTIASVNTDETSCKCLPGYSKANSQCQACSVGTFKVSIGDEQCTSCPANAVCPTTTNFTCAAGAYLSGTSCLQCESGTYKTITGNSTCVNCPQNATCLAGSSSYSCSAGYFLSGANKCLACSGNTYKSTVGNDTCTPCHSNAVILTQPAIAQSNCTCLAGYEPSGSGQCISCSSGYKLSVGNQNCTACPVGGVCLPTSWTCGAGYTNSSSTCVQCTQNTFKSTTGNSTCLACASGSQSTVASAACLCSPGYYRSSLDGTCTPCPMNQFKSTVGDAASCTVCPGGSKTSGLGSTSSSECICPAGTYKDKTTGICATCPSNAQCPTDQAFLCDAGYTVNIYQDGCDPCAQGTYKSTQGNDTCTNCPSNMSTNSTGYTSSSACVCDVNYEPVGNQCRMCATDLFKTTVGNSSCSFCPFNAYCFGTNNFMCNPGYTISDNEKSCQQCLQGFYKSTTSNDTCIQCPLHSNTTGPGSTTLTDCRCEAGYYWNGDQCDQCPIGTYKSSAGNQQCTPCSNLQTTSGLGSVSASECFCPPSTYRNPQTLVCSQCPQNALCSGADYFTCLAGYEVNQQSNGCQPCAQGTYKTSNGNSTCTPCPPRQSTTGPGIAVSDQCFCAVDYEKVGSDCVACQPSNYKNVVSNTTFCSLCPSNAQCFGSGTSSWYMCNAGYQIRLDLKGCDQCAQGTFKPAGGNFTCASCPPNSHCPQGSLDWTCSAGFYFQDNVCLACPVGQFKSANSNGTTCTTCATNTNTTGSGQSTCLCQPGYFRNSTSQCELCPSGTYKSHLGDDSSCFNCPSNAQCSGTGLNIFTCRPGYTISADQTSCTLCPEGTFKNSTSNQQCFACPQNAYCPPGSLGWSCAAGYVLNGTLCSACPIGQIKPTIGNQTQCTACPALTSTNSTAGIVCECAKGYRFSTTSQTCVACSVGYYKSNVGNTPCTLCPYDSDCFGTGFEMFDCTSGYTLNATDDGLSCEECPIGTWKNYSGNALCTNCPPNSQTRYTGMTLITDCVCSPGYTRINGTCTACPAGTYKYYVGNGECDECPLGALCDGGDSGFTCDLGHYFDQDTFDIYYQCDYCPMDTYKDTIGNQTCTDCPPGSYYEYDSATSIFDCYCDPGFGYHNGSCVECPLGTYKDTFDLVPCFNCPQNAFCNYTDTFECNPGYYLLNETSCTPCPLGSSKDWFGNDECLCNANLTNVDGQCVQCENGTVKDYIGNEPCSCDFGYYLNDTQCLKCPVGMTSEEFDATSCVCDYNYYRTSLNESMCVQCPQNTTKEYTGDGDCYCDNDSYQPNLNSTQCIKCPTGSTAYNDGCFCPPNLYLNSTLYACVSCPTNSSKYDEGNENTCLCDAGFFYSEKQQKCTQCPSNSFKDYWGNEVCDCFPGYTWNNVTEHCVPCPINTFKDWNGTDECWECPVLSVAPTNGSIQCICDQGAFFVSSDPLVTECDYCYLDQYKTVIGNEECTLCPELADCESTNGTSFVCIEGATLSADGLGCEYCPFDTYKSIPGNQSCTICPSSSFTLTEGALTVDECKNVCPAGYFENLATFTCDLCEYGYFKRRPGNDTCDPCPVGMVSYPWDTVPVSCFCDGGRFLESETCLRCPEGTFAPVPETASNLTQCLPCPEGGFCPQGSISFTCFPGYTVNANLTSCVKCGQGFYKNVAGFTECLKCPQNFTSTVSETATSASECVCKPGYQIVNGKCVECAPGLYKSTLSSTDVCFERPTENAVINADRTGWICAPGYFLDAEMSTCEPCALDSFKVVAGNEQCTQCDQPNEVAISSANSTECECSPGYTRVNGSCAMCSQGLYKSESGDYECDECPEFNNCQPGSIEISCLPDYALDFNVCVPLFDAETSSSLENEPRTSSSFRRNQVESSNPPIVPASSSLVPRKSFSSSKDGRSNFEQSLGLSTSTLAGIASVLTIALIAGVMALVYALKYRKPAESKVPTSMVSANYVHASPRTATVPLNNTGGQTQISKFTQEVVSKSSKNTLEVDVSKLETGDGLSVGSVAGIYSVRFISRDIPELVSRRIKQQEKFVLKIVDTELGYDIYTERVQMVHKEFRILSELNHPNIVKVIAFVEDPYAIVLEHWPTTLDQELYDPGMTALGKFMRRQVQIQFARELASAIYTLHGNKIAHCNISPEHILLRYDQEDTSKERPLPVLCGFSAALELGDNLKIETSLKYGFSLAYASPEILQLKASKTSAVTTRLDLTASDVYSFGMTMCAIVTQKKPYEYATTPQEILSDFSGEQTLRFFTAEATDINELIRDMCSFKPQLRPTVGAVAEKLMIMK